MPKEWMGHKCSHNCSHHHIKFLVSYYSHPCSWSSFRVSLDLHLHKNNNTLGLKKNIKEKPFWSVAKGTSPVEGCLLGNPNHGGIVPKAHFRGGSRVQFPRNQFGLIWSKLNPWVGLYLGP
jgi:hypothetical protein